MAATSEITVDIMERLVKLEKSDTENKNHIAMLETQINEMEKSFLDRETVLLQEIDELKDKLANEYKTVEDTHGNSDEQPAFDHDSQDHTIQKKRSLRVREVVETEVAFYATHSQHDIRHLGQNQIIIFDKAVTNIGNAYNTHHGAFVAPVDGTYVFHVTLMGTVHNSTNHYYYANIDVNDVGYSRFYITPYDQSSHMFVVELTTGSTVSVKNGRVDDGVVGQHYSSFSGFLLYQHEQSSAIIGK